MKRFVVTVFLALAQAGPLAAAPKTLSTAVAANPPGGSQGMVIRGDQEAPLVLYIVPWQEPRTPALPEAPLQPLLPAVLDSDRSLIDDPVNRSLGASDRAKGK